MTASGPKTAGKPRRSAGETREHILAVAADRFYWEGVHATGVDAIAAGAQVAPTTLYRLFSSKDDLVAAYVERCSAAYKRLLTAASSPTAGSARERILAVFDAFTAEALSDACRGCPFLMVLAEFPDPSHPAHIEAVAHKAWVRDLLHGLVCELAAETPMGDPACVADELALIAEGIYGSVQSLGASGPARLGRTCAEILLDVATTAFRAAE
jgi:AcrR family transcriptional regulator